MPSVAKQTDWSGFIASVTCVDIYMHLSEGPINPHFDHSDIRCKIWYQVHFLILNISYICKEWRIACLNIIFRFVHEKEYFVNLQFNDLFKIHSIMGFNN